MRKNRHQSGRQAKRAVILFSVALILSACGGGSSSSPDPGIPTPTPTPAPLPTEYSYAAPADISDGWQVNNAESVGIDTAVLEDVINRIQDNEFGFRRIDSVSIAKDGELILDARLRQSLDFADDWANNRDIDLHVVNSVTKSIMSLAMGVAIEQGYFSDTQALIHDYLTADATIANWNQNKAGITLQNYLTMQHGYQWDEWNVNYLEPENQNYQMNNAQDPMQFLLDLPMVTQPGTTFAYSTGVSYALGVMISNASGESLFGFMNNNLFLPMGIAKTDFWSLDGHLHAGSALYLTARDMTKFGQLILNGGEWNGQQLVPQPWIEESVAGHVSMNDNFNVTYGYQWWAADYDVAQESIPSLRAISARGFGGQLIYIFPEIDTVITFTGHRYEDGQESETDIRMIMRDYLLPELAR